MILDTNIVIAFLGGEKTVISVMTEWKKGGRALFISAVTFGEVLSLSNLSHSEIEKIKIFLNSFISIPLDNEIVESAAFLRRIYRVSLPDAIIAATSFKYKVPLVTRDRQFRKIKEITVIDI